MSQFTALLVGESPMARKFKIVDRELWIPRSVTTAFTKFAPDKEGHCECLVTVEDWFAEKEDL